MRISSTVVMLSVLALAACGGGTGPGAKEPDPWADFKGTYGGPVTSHASSSTPKESARREAKAKEQAHVEEAAPAKKTSKATIHGESISTVGEDSVADAAKGALKTKLVSTKVVTGAQHELVKVQLKGATVSIIRPASTPDGKGSVDAPRSRSGALAKGEAGYYDEDADVLVIVDANKRNAAEKALAALVSR